MVSAPMLTLPNFLTLLRIIAIPVFLVLLTGGNHAAAFVLFLCAGITDAIDGAVARLTDSRSELGAVLDPMADKLLLLSSFIVLGYLLIYLVHQESMEVDPSRWGKVNTFFELFTVGFALMTLAKPMLPYVATTLDVFQWVTAVTTAASGTQYVYRGLLWHQQHGNVVQ
jgi:cardiolipin synthase